MGRAVGANPCLAAEFNGASKFGTDHTGLGCGHTTGVESPHGELRSWLSDGLSRDDANRFTEVNKFVVGQCPPVATAANGTVGFAGEWRTNAHCCDTGLFKADGQRWIDLCIALRQNSAIGTNHLSGGQPTHETATETMVLRLDDNVTGRAAIIFTDNHVLSDVDKTTGQITGVGCT